jgi:hypothetical protein
VYQIAIRVLASGERALFLLDGQGCPLFYPTLFTTSQLRNAGAPANTIKNKLAHVAVLLRWQDDRKRDLVDDFRCGRFLTVADVASLRDLAQRDMRDVRRADKRPRRPAWSSLRENGAIHGASHCQWPAAVQPTDHHR